jgi:hypothetical protein
MQSTKTDAARRAPAVLAGLIAVALSPAVSSSLAYASCEFAPVKQQIDAILDRDPEKAAKFRREVTSGSDSIAVIESLVSPDMAKQIDICRFDTAEYLTKRGFPPFH